MGNTCSNTPTQPDSIRVQEDNNPTSIWNYNPVPNNDNLKKDENGSLYCQIYLASFYNTNSGSFCGHLFLMKSHDVDNEEEQVVHRYSFLFFEFISKPTRITIEKQTDGKLKISFIHNVDTVLFEQVWNPSEYVMEEESGHLKSIVKKKMIDGVSSDIPMIDESAQVVKVVPSNTSASRDFDVVPNNRSASNALEVVPSNRSATHALEFVSIGSGAGVSTLPKNVPPPEAVGRSLVNPNKLFMFQKQYQQMLEQIMRQYEMLQQIMSRGKVDPRLCFPQCDYCMKQSAKNARNVFGRTPVITFDNRSVSDSISPPRVIKSDDIDMCIKFPVNGVAVSLILTVPKDVIGEIAYMYRVNDQYVLGTVSRLINQYVALLQLDCDPSKTSIVLSDNRHRFLLWICHQMRLIISRLKRRASSENATSCVRIATCVDASSAVKDVYHRQKFERCGPVEESTTRRNIKTVGTFSGMKYMFTVLEHSNQIVYRLLNCDYPYSTEFFVQFDIVNVFSLKVYELLTGVYLIVIQTKSGQTYLSGYLSTNATACFATCQITSNLEERRFQSFEHISGTVFKCIFSDGTERTFSIESGSYATINEVFHV